MQPLRALVEVNAAGPTASGPEGGRFECIARSPSASEYMELRPGAVLVHRVAPSRSALARLARAARLRLSEDEAFALRAAEKLFELELLWNRSVVGVSLPEEPTREAFRKWRLASVLRGHTREGPPSTWPPPAPAPTSVELVCCTYNRYDSLAATVPSLLRELDQARHADVPCTLRFVYQNDDWRPWFEKRFPEAASHSAVELVPCSPPGLPRARNRAVERSQADVLVFVDDDVELDPGFVEQHLRTLREHPEAVGSAGRIRSRIEGIHRLQQDPAVGQVRLFGAVDANFGSTAQVDGALVVHSPRGANMAYRRREVTALLGRADWFDASLEGSAHREETTLAVELFQRGGLVVYSPDASLIHFEEETGGCENRAPPSLRHVINHRSMEHLFLQRLYAKSTWARLSLPWATWLRDLRLAPTGQERRLLAVGGLVGLWKGVRRARQSEPWPPRRAP